jgi:hypothetical protein
MIHTSDRTNTFAILGTPLFFQGSLLFASQLRTRTCGLSYHKRDAHAYLVSPNRDIGKLGVYFLVLKRGGPGPRGTAQDQYLNHPFCIIKSFLFLDDDYYRLTSKLIVRIWNCLWGQVSEHVEKSLDQPGSQ